ncbi:hypothetical protein Acor_65850 [Acrocarpospora corrugata]|uniref:Uncharacterized protein n=1 Tax=Acrocarpospora corrugata TaxID=35763 RepID=A0A5M3W641_9ACTN|nr:hypothetical protein Acor_65850 [Acrocarpospora corrugata]
MPEHCGECGRVQQRRQGLRVQALPSCMNHPQSVAGPTDAMFGSDSYRLAQTKARAEHQTG